MLKIYQQTIRKPVSFEGIGLHSGKKSKISIYPGEDDQGIIFKRIDLKKNNIILIGSSMGAWIALNQFKYFKSQIKG